jgi:trans-2-enoyl-CoA reductase
MQRAIFQQFGQPEQVLTVEDSPAAPLRAGEVRVRMLAASVNPADINFIQGTYGIKPELPATPGGEGCGEVSESADPAFVPGERVIFLGRAATWQSAVVVAGSLLFKLPQGIDPLQAAMLKVNPPTAWRLLTAFAPLPMGSWLVQNAANSGVGRCVIQLAREMGLRTLNVVRRDELHAELIELGADAVLTESNDLVADALAITGGQRPLLALNAVGGDAALRQLNLLADGGQQVTYGAMGRRPLTVPNGLLIFKQLSLHGLWISRWLETAPRDELDATFSDLARLMLAGSLSQAVDSTYPLARVRAACLRAQQEGRAGKVLLDLRG